MTDWIYLVNDSSESWGYDWGVVDHFLLQKEEVSDWHVPRHRGLRRAIASGCTPPPR